MAQADRKFGSDIETLTVGGTNLLSQLVSGSVAFELDNKESKALKDTWKYPVAGVKAVKLDLTLTVETTAPLMSVWGTSVAIVFDTGPVSYSFTGLIGAPTHDISDGAQTVKATIMSQGAVTVA